jgi:hypothetical protein
LAKSEPFTDLSSKLRSQLPHLPVEEGHKWVAAAFRSGCLQE